MEWMELYFKLKILGPIILLSIGVLMFIIAIIAGAIEVYIIKPMKKNKK